MDELDRLAEAGGDLLQRVDTLLARGGAPDDHRVWPLLRGIGALPGAAFESFAALRPTPLAAAGHAVRQHIRRYDDACATLTAQVHWSGTAASAFTVARTALVSHLDQGPESLVGRLESTAGYADALADWVDRSRLALARILAEVLGSAEAVTVVGAYRSDEPVSPREAYAAAEIAARVLAALSVAYDGAERLLRQWSPSLAESAYRPPAASTFPPQDTLWIGH